MICLWKSSGIKTGVVLATLAVSQEANAVSVGKCKFYYYLGREQPTGQGRTTTEKLVIFTDPTRIWATWGSTGASQAVEGEEETWAGTFTLVSV